MFDFWFSLCRRVVTIAEADCFVVISIAARCPFRSYFVYLFPQMQFDLSVSSHHPQKPFFSCILFFLTNGRAIFSLCDCYYDWMIEQWRVAAKKKMAALFLSVCERSFYLIVWEGEGMDRYIYTLDLKRRRSIASRLLFL